MLAAVRSALLGPLEAVIPGGGCGPCRPFPPTPPTPTPAPGSAHSRGSVNAVWVELLARPAGGTSLVPSPAADTLGVTQTATNCGWLEPRRPAEETGLLPAQWPARTAVGLFFLLGLLSLLLSGAVSPRGGGEGRPEPCPAPRSSPQVPSAFHLVAEGDRWGGPVPLQPQTGRPAPPYPLGPWAALGLPRPWSPPLPRAWGGAGSS